MSVQVRSLYCPDCKRMVTAVRNGHAVRKAVGWALAGPFGLLVGNVTWICPDGHEILFRRPAPGDVWACEKNGHALSRKRHLCPIDGSAVIWRRP